MLRGENGSEGRGRGVGLVFLVWPSKQGFALPIWCKDSSQLLRMYYLFGNALLGIG